MEAGAGAKEEAGRPPVAHFSIVAHSACDMSRSAHRCVLSLSVYYSLSVLAFLCQLSLGAEETQAMRLQEKMQEMKEVTAHSHSLPPSLRPSVLSSPASFPWHVRLLRCLSHFFVLLSAVLLLLLLCCVVLCQLDEQYALHVRRYEARMRRVAEGEAAFRVKQANTIAYLRRFKGFIAETDQKRSRAEKKEHEERKQKEEKDGELGLLNAQLARSKRSRDRIKRKNGQPQRQRNRHTTSRPLHRTAAPSPSSTQSPASVSCVVVVGCSDVYCQYRLYLESALLASDQFSEIDELINRHHILQQTHDDLTTQAQQVGLTH